jgi:hypothetical protein
VYLLESSALQRALFLCLARPEVNIKSVVILELTHETWMMKVLAKYFGVRKGIDLSVA